MRRWANKMPKLCKGKQIVMRQQEQCQQTFGSQFFFCTIQDLLSFINFHHTPKYVHCCFFSINLKWLKSYFPLWREVTKNVFFHFLAGVKKICAPVSLHSETVSHLHPVSTSITKETSPILTHIIRLDLNIFFPSNSTGGSFTIQWRQNPLLLHLKRLQAWLLLFTLRVNILDGCMNLNPGLAQMQSQPATVYPPLQLILFLF